MLALAQAIVLQFAGRLNLTKQMWPARWFPTLVCILFAWPGGSWAQKASNWRAFRAADGLAESVNKSVTISSRGNVWIRHFEANTIDCLDGYEVQSIPSPGMGNYRVYEGRAGQI